MYQDVLAVQTGKTLRGLKDKEIMIYLINKR
jgi:hypothetical protein